MVGFQKIIRITDAVLDCVPIVSTLSNAAQLLYQSACKVDTLNPVAPGLKTSLQIYVLSKSKWSCYIGLVPVLGNILNLVKLVTLLGRLIETLPQKGALRAMIDLFLREDLIEANRAALIAKTKKDSLSFEFLEAYWTAVISNPLTARSKNYRSTQFMTLLCLLDRAQLRPPEKYLFISHALRDSDSIHLSFIHSLVEKYEASFTPQIKKDLLKSIFEGSGVGMLDGTKKNLFSAWINKWKSEIAPLAHELCADATRLYKRYLQNAERDQSGDRHTKGALALSILPFKQVLLRTFPDCDQTPRYCQKLCFRPEHTL